MPHVAKAVQLLYTLPVVKHIKVRTTAVAFKSHKRFMLIAPLRHSVPKVHRSPSLLALPTNIFCKERMNLSTRRRNSTAPHFGPTKLIPAKIWSYDPQTFLKVFSSAYHLTHKNRFHLVKLPAIYDAETLPT